jgi:hypothetical protein
LPETPLWQLKSRLFALIRASELKHSTYLIKQIYGLKDVNDTFIYFEAMDLGHLNAKYFGGALSNLLLESKYRPVFLDNLGREVPVEKNALTA